MLEPVKIKGKSKVPEARVSKWRLVLVLYLIGRESGASFLDQSQNKVKQQ